MGSLSGTNFPLPTAIGACFPPYAWRHLHHIDERSSTLQTPSIDQILLWHQLWRDFRKKTLPDELIVILMRFLGAIVPDRERTTRYTSPIKAESLDESTTTKEWFHSPPFNRRSLSAVAQMRLETVSHDQGWNTDLDTQSWSWFEIALVDSQGRVKGGLRRLTDSLSAVQNRELATDNNQPNPILHGQSFPAIPVLRSDHEQIQTHP